MDVKRIHKGSRYGRAVVGNGPYGVESCIFYRGRVNIIHYRSAQIPEHPVIARMEAYGQMKPPRRRAWLNRWGQVALPDNTESPRHGLRRATPL